MSETSEWIAARRAELKRSTPAPWAHGYKGIRGPSVSGAPVMVLFTGRSPVISPQNEHHVISAHNSFAAMLDVIERLNDAVALAEQVQRAGIGDEPQEVITHYTIDLVRFLVVDSKTQLAALIETGETHG